MMSRQHFLRGLGATALAGVVLLPSGRAESAATIRPGGTDAFIVIDVQNCFVPGGSLAVRLAF